MTTKMTISFRVSAAADFSWRARMPRDLRAVRSQERLRLRLERLVDDGGFQAAAEHGDSKIRKEDEDSMLDDVWTAGQWRIDPRFFYPVRGR